MPDGEALIASALARTTGDVQAVLSGGLPPELELLSGTNIVQSDFEYELHYRVVARNGGIGRVEYRINGTTMGNPNARLASLSAGYGVYRRPITLGSGENKISVVVYDEDNQVASNTLVANVMVEESPNQRPHLYVLAIGVSDYYEDAFDLKWAAKDALAVADRFDQERKYAIYQDVTIVPLVNNEATRENIAEKFKSLGEKITRDDVFVLFMAGHGIVENNRYHFLPHEAIYSGKEELLAQSIDHGMLTEMLGGIAASKSLVLLDSCGAGAFIDDSGTLALARSNRKLVEKGALSQLMKATGRMTLAATTSQEFALEGHREHGVFSFSLLEALGAITPDKGISVSHDGDDWLTVDEIQSHIMNRVPEITFHQFQYRQIPMRQIDGQVFPIATALK